MWHILFHHEEQQSVVFQTSCTQLAVPHWIVSFCTIAGRVACPLNRASIIYVLGDAGVSAIRPHCRAFSPASQQGVWVDLQVPCSGFSRSDTPKVGEGDPRTQPQTYSDRCNKCKIRMYGYTTWISLYYRWLAGQAMWAMVTDMVASS